MEVLDKLGYSNRLNPLEALPLDWGLSKECGSSLSGETEGVKRAAFKLLTNHPLHPAFAKATARSPSPIKGEDL